MALEPGGWAVQNDVPEDPTPSNRQPDEAGSVGSTKLLPLEEVGNLIDLIRESGVGEVHVRRHDFEVVVKTKAEGYSRRKALKAKERASQEPDDPGTAKPMPGQVLHTVRSPMVGTLYRAPAPGEQPYVLVGDRVEAGQTLCVVEAMKLMSEISADVGGEVVEILVGNAEGIQFDQPLFYLRPAD